MDMWYIVLRKYNKEEENGFGSCYNYNNINICFNKNIIGVIYVIKLFFYEINWKLKTACIAVFYYNLNFLSGDFYVQSVYSLNFVERKEIEKYWKRNQNFEKVLN